MKILVSWLREFVDVPVGIRDLADALQDRGFEVASVEMRPASGPGEDGIIDLEVTTNRPDCLNMQGIAREVAATYGLSLRDPATTPLDTGSAGEALPVRVILEDPELCPRYAAAVADVRIAPSPPWLTSRLEAAGIRAINNVVDITNYVMLELGQPLHAFDHALLAGHELRIRRARHDEPLTTLDGVARKLDVDVLVIADAQRAQAVAGVMGGGGSEVSPRTKVVVFESAYFQPVSVRRTARKLALSTEASYRFERGANIQMPVAALARVAALLETSGAGTMRPGVIDSYPAPRTPADITLRHNRIERVLGYVIQPQDVERILRALGFDVTKLTTDPLAWQVTVPPFRVDIAREVDLVEEVARHAGYNRLPTTFPALRDAPAPPDARLQRERVARKVALAAGFSESLTFTFIERAAALRFVSAEELVPLVNPLSEKYAVMRPSLLPGLLDSVGHNRRRERRDVQLFELGARMSVANGETRGIACAWTGSATPEHWSGQAREVTFYDMKGVVESLLACFRVPAVFVPVVHPALAPGCAAEVRAAAESGPGSLLGIVGQVSTAAAEAHGLPAHDAIFIAELDLDALAPLVDLGEDVRVAPLPRHPSVVRDLSVLVPISEPAAALRHTIRQAAPPTLERLYEFARYEGKGIPEGQLSLSFRLVFRAADRTLTDGEVQQATDHVLAALTATHQARLR